MVEIKICAACGSMYKRPKDRSNSQWAARKFCGLQCAAKTSSRQSNALLRILENCIPEPNSGCWIWASSLHENGYGQIRVNGKRWLSHRLSYAAHFGPIANELFILHKCDNRACVNPDHLYAGTARDNAMDAVRRGRKRTGDRHPKKKLTSSQIGFIRGSNLSHAALGRHLNVTPQAIGHVRSQKTWRSV